MLLRLLRPPHLHCTQAVQFIRHTEAHVQAQLVGLHVVVVVS